jgi:hypothetical protein
MNTLSQFITKKFHILIRLTDIPQNIRGKIGALAMAA